MRSYDILAQSVFDAVSVAAKSMTGIYLNVRRQGYEPSAIELRNAKLEVLMVEKYTLAQIESALFLFESQAQVDISKQAQELINPIIAQMTLKTVKAISKGHGNGPATLLGNTAHGAMGELVGCLASHLDLAVRDTSGRNWKKPEVLAKTAVRGLAYQSAVNNAIFSIKQLGHNKINVKDYGEVSMDKLNEVYHALFHPNSHKFPEIVSDV